MRTFVQLRRLMDSNADLARKIASLEKKYDEKFAVVFAAIKQLITPPEPTSHLFSSCCRHQDNTPTAPNVRDEWSGLTHAHLLDRRQSFDKNLCHFQPRQVSAN
jgi:hypothetical protein